MLSKKNLLFLVGFVFFSRDILAKKEPKNSPKVGTKITQPSTQELLKSAQLIFDEFKKITGIDLVVQIGQAIKNNISSQGKANDPLLKLSVEEITLFFAPMQLMTLIQQAMQAQENKTDSNSKIDPLQNQNPIVAMMNEFCHELYMANVELYLKFKLSHNDQAAYEVLLSAIQNLSRFIFKMMQGVEGEQPELQQ